MLSISSSAVARLAARSSRPAAATATAATTRSMGMKVREEIEECPPNFSMDAIKPPPHGFGEPYPEALDPMAYHRKPVTSAHAVDLSGEEGGAASALDSAAFGPAGAVVHGRFGAVDAAACLLRAFPPTQAAVFVEA